VAVFFKPTIKLLLSVQEDFCIKTDNEMKKTVENKEFKEIVGIPIVNLYDRELCESDFMYMSLNTNLSLVTVI
jgi:hypothetical protein